MSSEEEKKPSLLTEEEVEKYAKMTYDEKRNFYFDDDLQERFVNTLKSLDEDLKSTEGLHRFIETGVLVTDQIILSARSESIRGLGMKLITLNQQQNLSITVELTLEDAKRLLKILPDFILAAKKNQQLTNLKELYNEKNKSRRW